MKIYNSLSRQIEEFIPINPTKVGVYACGPTVYSFVTIGNWRTYFLGDLLVRTLKYLNYGVTYVMNITDVGHLTGDNLGDSSSGEDRLEKAATKENKTAWDLAKFYTDDFLDGYKKLNLTQPEVFCKATDHIAEQIDLIKKIEAKGLTYKISDGIYFDVLKYEQKGDKYGQLSNIDQIKEGARIEPNPDKKDPRDFALWKFSYPDGRDYDEKIDGTTLRRHMEWSSPWGLGFPGWHIECSAMSAKYLGEQFDIHLGGEDLMSTHHPNEIAQSEIASGKKPFVKYWMHGRFLLINGGRMGKSLGNAYTLQDIESHGFKPEHLRYFYFTGQYRQSLNFTWENMEAAKNSYKRLVEKIRDFGSKTQNSKSKTEIQNLNFYQDKFKQYLEDDLNTPQILALVWDVIKSGELNEAEKIELLLDWDQILGFNLKSLILNLKSNKYTGEHSGITIESEIELSSDLIDLIDQREMARREKNWEKADEIRNNLQAERIVLEDVETGVKIKNK